MSELFVPKNFKDERYFWYYDTHHHKGDGAESCLEKLRKWIEDKKVFCTVTVYMHAKHA